MALDPVCGRDVHPKQSQWLLAYHGNTYHFCSGACAHRFNDFPDEFAAIEPGHEPILLEQPAPPAKRRKELVLAR